MLHFNFEPGGDETVVRKHVIHRSRDVMFSVVVPLYNKEKFIKRCIDSILCQNCIDFEIIVVDDESTDDSASIASSFNDPRIKIIKKTNGGPGSARNRGVTESSGEWIAFLDADDAWTNDHLEELKLLIETFEDAGIVATKSTEIKAGRIPSELIKDDRWKRHRVDYFRCASEINGFINSSSVAIKRQVFDKVGYFKHMQQGEDTEFWSRVCLSYPCAVSNKPTSFYFRGTGGIIEQLWAENIKNQDKVDIGPNISFLIDELSTGNMSNAMKDSVITFINSRITTALKINLYSGQIDKLIAISEFYAHPLSFRYWFWKKLASQPRWFLMNLYNARNFVRTVYRSLNAKFAVKT